MVTVESSTPAYTRFEGEVERSVATALLMEGSLLGEVAVVLTGDEEIADFHERFMGVSGPTDVLSWPAGEIVGLPNEHLGDVMVSCERAHEQAAGLGHSWEREVCVLAVHGVLHLLGWVDSTPEQQQEMQARVDAIVDAAGA